MKFSRRIVTALAVITLMALVAVAAVGALRAWLVARGAPYAEAFTEIKRIRAAVAQDMASDETALFEGAEVAFFPPVTGG